MIRKTNLKLGVFLFLLFFAGICAVSYAETMFSVPATVDAIDLKAKSMKITYTDPDTKETKQHSVFWDKSTEFIKEGPPPDMKESPAKSRDIKKGTKLYVRISNAGQKDGKLRLDAVKLKP